MKPPVKFSKTPASIRLDPPRPGQDNNTIFDKTIARKSS